MNPTGKGFKKIISIGEQTAFKTEASSYSSFLMFTDESLALTKTEIKPDDVAGQAGRELSLEGRKAVGGDITVNLRPEGGAWLLMKHAFGTVATSQPDPSGGPSVYRHVFTLADAIPQDGLSVKVDRDIDVFAYIGIKVQSVAFDYGMDTPLSVTFTLVGYDELTGKVVETPVFTVALPFKDYQGVFTMDGVEERINAFSLTIANSLREDDYASGDQSRERIERASFRDVTGTFSRRYINNDLYTKFLNWTNAALLFTFTGSLIEGGYNYSLIISLPAVQFTGSTPGTGGADMGPQDVPFTALRDIANNEEEVKLTLTNTESSY